MSFLIRTIDHTASGREIVRERDHADDTLTIGRASENDLHLPDLAVEQRHARIAPADAPGKLRIESVGGLGFAYDGRKTTGATFDPREGAEFGFGSYRIAISHQGDAPVTATVTKVAEKEGAGDAFQGFALASALPSKRAMAWIGFIAILVAFLAVPVYSHLTRTPVAPGTQTRGAVAMDASWSPGKLSLAHHGLEDDCEACHVEPFQSVRDETCLSCHTDIGDHAPVPRQLAGRGPMSAGDRMLWAAAETFGKEGPGSCTTCHTEHEGAGRMEPTRQQFCADCHGTMDTRLTDTALGNAADFGTAHPHFQAVLFTTLGSRKTERLSLADHPREASGLRFPHALHLDPNGGVARMAGNIGAKYGYGDALECADCHEPNGDETGFLPVDMEDDCEACHSLVYDKVGSTFRTLRHGDIDQLRADLAAMDRAPRRPITSGRRRPGQFAEGGLYYQDYGSPARSLVGINRALAPGGVCGECHIPTTTGGRADVVPVNLRSRYLLDGRFDHEDHKQEKCTSCHKAESSDTSSDVLLPDISQCRTCHLGEDAREAEVPSSCAMCHSYHPKPGPMPAGHPGAVPDRIARLSRRMQ